MHRNLMFTLIFSLLVSSISTTFADEKKSTCTDELIEINQDLERDNRFATKDVLLSTIFTLPIAFFFPPAAIFSATALGFKVAAMVHVKNSHDVLDIFEEARIGRGPKTLKLYRKIMRSHPHASLTYKDFIEEISKHDLNGEDCLPNKYPRKRDFVNVIEL
jgi:hypothetical protein